MMKQKHALDRIQIILLSLLCVALLLLTGYIVFLQIQNREPTDAILPVSDVTPDSSAPSAAVSPTAAPTPDPMDNRALQSASDPTPEPEWQFDTFADRFWQDGIRWTETEYKSPDLRIIYRRVYDTETFHRRLTYFTAEIFVSDVTQIQTASCKDDFSRIGHGDVEEMAIKNNAIVAISGDYYGFHRDSLVIRNGTVYRTKLRSGDICLLLRDGTMETIRGSKADINVILEKDPWQAWQFGPSLMTGDGEARSSFPDSTLNNNNPRSCIGYIEPGHYFFVVVDGRQKYSRGVTLAELAQLMESLGCTVAFNLDGGASAHFFWNGQVVSNPSGGGREISDIIYIAKETYPVSLYHPGKDGLSE